MNEKNSVIQQIFKKIGQAKAFDLYMCSREFLLCCCSYLNGESEKQTLSDYSCVSVLVLDDRHVAFCEYNGSVARIICVATLANEKLLERAPDNDFLLCRKLTSNKTRYRQ